MSKIKVGIVVYYVPYSTRAYERDFGLVTEIIDCNFEVTSLKNGLGDERSFPLKYLGKKIFLNKATADKVAEQRSNPLTRNVICHRIKDRQQEGV